MKLLKNRITRNISSLALVQATNYILPLVLVPFIIRKVGIEFYGIINIANSVVQYFLVVADFGFNLIAARDIAQNKDNLEEISKIYCTVYFIKVALIIVSFLIFSIIIFSVDLFSQNSLVYFSSFLMIVGQTVLPVWLYHGLQKMKYLVWFNFLGKGIYFSLIIIFLKEPEHYALIPGYHAVGLFAAFIISFSIIHVRFGIKLLMPSMVQIRKYLVEAWLLFLSRFVANIYLSTNILILGFLTNESTVGVYSVAEKISNAFGRLSIITNQSIFPHLSKLFEDSKSKFFSFIERTIVLYLLSFALLSLGIYIYAEELILFVSGEVIVESVTVLKVLCISVIFSPFGGLFTQTIVIFKKNKVLFYLIMSSAIISVFLAFFLIERVGVTGLAITVSVTYFYIFVSHFYFGFYKMKRIEV